MTDRTAPSVSLVDYSKPFFVDSCGETSCFFFFCCCWPRFHFYWLPVCGGLMSMFHTAGGGSIFGMARYFAGPPSGSSGARQQNSRKKKDAFDSRPPLSLICTTPCLAVRLLKEVHLTTTNFFRLLPVRLLLVSFSFFLFSATSKPLALFFAHTHTCLHIHRHTHIHVCMCTKNLLACCVCVYWSSSLSLWLAGLCVRLCCCISL